jgi:uncharacterized protein with gpF-like domain
MAKYLIGSDRQAEQRLQSDLLDQLERRFQPAFARSIARAMRQMATEYRNTGNEPDLPPDHADEIRAEVQRVTGISIRVFGGRVLNATRSSPAEIERKDFADAIFGKLGFRYLALEAVRRRITRITETTRSTIIEMVSRGVLEGLGQEGIANTIMRAVPDIARARSALIARTETHGAAQYGALGSARESGLALRKGWVTTEDERTRPEHEEANGQTVDLDAYFTLAGFSCQHPGDPSLPVNHSANCRCGVVFVVAE